MPFANDSLTRDALNLLVEIAVQHPDAPNPRTREALQALLMRAEQGFPDPVFAPEQFAYLPVTCFDGDHITGVDIAFAALFAVAQTRLPLHVLSASTPKVAAWWHSLTRWQRNESAHLPTPTSTSGTT